MSSISPIAAVPRFASRSTENFRDPRIIDSGTKGHTFPVRPTRGLGRPKKFSHQSTVSINRSFSPPGLSARTWSALYKSARPPDGSVT